MADSALATAHRAADDLRAQFDRLGIEAPDLVVDLTAAVTGVAAVNVGRLPAHSAQQLAMCLEAAPPPRQ